MLLYELTCSAILLGLCNLLYWLDRGRRLQHFREASVFVQVTFSIFVALGLLTLVIMPFALLNVSVAILATEVCVRARASTLMFFNVSLAGTLGACLLAWLIWPRFFHPGEELQARYPLESMADPLAYENARTPPGDVRFEEARLADFEQRTEMEARQADLRTWMLTNLHRDSVERFINSPGFGMARNVKNARPDADRIDASGGGNYLQDPPPDDDSTTRPDDAPPASERRPADAALLTALGRGHGSIVLDFVNVRGFGYVRDREHAAGFRPHGLHNRPYFREDKPRETAYEVTRLELVSLLKFDQARVYVLPHSFPRMDRLGDGTTRSLDAFEDAALASLREGKDLVAEAAGGRVRLLGSIRAGRQCLACHAAARGELLGAFTYRLRKAGAAP